MDAVSERTSRDGWRRARTPEQQTQRRREILEAAYRLFRDLEYGEVSLNAIAREAGLSKPSIYLYFRTREEIFLEIFIADCRDWFEESIRAIDALPDGAAAFEAAGAWTAASWRNERLCVLAPLLATSIERNVSEERLAACVRMKREECARLRLVLQRFIPGITEAATFELMLCLFGLFGSLVSYERNPSLSAVLRRREFSGIDRDFQNGVAKALGRLMEGIRIELSRCPQTPHPR